VQRYSGDVFLITVNIQRYNLKSQRIYGIKDAGL